MFLKNTKIHVVNGGKWSVFKNKWCNVHSVCWNHSFQDKMSSSCGSKCMLTGTSRVGYGSSEQIPQACLKAKSPRAPERLTSPCLCAPTRHSLTGLWSIRTRLYQIAGRHGPIRREIWHRCTLCDTDPLCCCKSLCSIFATKTFTSWPADKQVCPVFCFDTHSLLPEWCHSFKQWSVRITVKPMVSYRYTPQVLRVSSPEVSSALTVYFISDCS